MNTYHKIFAKTKSCTLRVCFKNLMNYVLRVVIQYFFDDRSHSKCERYREYSKNDVTVCFFEGLSADFTRRQTGYACLWIESETNGKAPSEKFLNTRENEFYMILFCHVELQFCASKKQNNFTLAHSVQLYCENKKELFDQKFLKYKSDN